MKKVMLDVQPGSELHAESCCRIANECCIFNIGSPEKGFLPLIEEKESFSHELQEGFSLVAFHDRSFVGFLIGFFKASPTFQKILSPERVASMDVEKFLADENVLFIKTVAVSPSYKSKGVGSALYGKLFEELPLFSFCGFIIESPIKNRASILFHQKMGFTRIASSELRLPVEHPKLQNGIVGLYYRKNNC